MSFILLWSLVHSAFSVKLQIDPQSLNQIFYTTSETINVYVGLSDGATFNGDTVSLSLVSTDSSCLQGDKSKDSYSGAVTMFFSIKVVCEGNFTLKASSNKYESSYSDTFEVLEDSYSIRLSVNNQVDINIKFVISIGLYDIKQAMWTESVSLNVSSPESTFDCDEKMTNIIYTDYEITMHCVFGKSGPQSIMIKTIDTSVVKSVQVNPLSFKFTSKMPEYTMSDEPFSVSIQAYSSDGVTQVTDSGFSVYLELACSQSPCSGELLENGGSISNPKQTEWGAYNFTSIYVKSHGVFQLYVYDAGDRNTYGYSDTFMSYNKVKNIATFINTDLTSAFTYINAQISITGEDGGPYLNKSTIYLEEVSFSGRALLGGTTNVTIDANDNITTSKIYYSNYGQKKLRARIGSVYGDSSTINIKHNVIKISEVKPLPKNTRDVFNFKVEVYDWKGSDKISDISVPVIISTSPSSDTGGENEYKTKNGVATIDNFIIKEGGTYKLVVTVGSYTKKSDTEYEIEQLDCSMPIGPLVCFVVLLAIGFLVSIIFFLLDFDVKSYRFIRFKVLVIHPITGMFIKQPNYRRSLISMQFAAVNLLLLLIIAAVYEKYDTPTKSYSNNFDDFFNEEIFKGLFAWGICQAFQIPLFYLNTRAGESTKYMKIGALASFLLMTFSTAGIIGMTVNSCLGCFNYWIYNFVFFFIADFIFAQVIYSFISIAFLGRFAKLELGDILDS